MGTRWARHQCRIPARLRVLRHWCHNRQCFGRTGDAARADGEFLHIGFARKGQDRFDGLKWRRGKTGVPLLPGVLAAIECAVRQRFTAGDHDVFVGEMVGARVAAGAPLIHLAGRYRRLDVSR